MGNYWTDMLTNYDIKKLVERMLFSMEYKYLTHNIKSAQKEAKMSYSVMFNSIVAGIFFPESAYEYGTKSYVKEYRQKLGLAKNAVLADYISSEDMYKIIHTLHSCSELLISNKDFGWNAKMFAYQFNQIAKEINKKVNQNKIEAKSVFLTERIKGVGEKSKYRLGVAKTLIRHVKKEGSTIALRPYTKKRAQAKFEEELKNYNAKKQLFHEQLEKRTISEEKRRKLTAALDSGFYGTVIPYFGFNIESLMKRNDANIYLSKREITGHINKFIKATEVLKNNQKTPLVELAEKLEVAGRESRNEFITTHHAYPEHTKGFYNSCIEMFADKNMKYDETALVESGLGMSVPYVLKKTANTLNLLAEQYENSNSPAEKQEIEKQAEKAQILIEKSNEFSI